MIFFHLLDLIQQGINCVALNTLQSELEDNIFVLEPYAVGKQVNNTLKNTHFVFSQLLHSFISSVIINFFLVSIGSC
jgi:hypothetical protein